METLLKMNMNEEKHTPNTPSKAADDHDRELEEEVKKEKQKKLLKSSSTKSVRNPAAFQNLSIPYEKREQIWHNTREIWHQGHQVMGGWLWWRNLKEDEIFVLQEHITGLWPHTHRILLKKSSMQPICVAHCSSKEKTLDGYTLLTSYLPFIKNANILDLKSLTKLFKLIEGQLEENPDRIMELAVSQILEQT